MRRAFSADTLAAIEQTIEVSERAHGGEICFAVEHALDAPALRYGLSPRERAIQLFGQLGVWDTEHNNGVLIYVLWADHDVEIVADRGFNDKVTPEQWAAVCHRMETAFANGQPKQAVIEGISAVGALIAQHYPATDRNEVPNRAVLL